MASLSYLQKQVHKFLDGAFVDAKLEITRYSAQATATRTIPAGHRIMFHFYRNDPYWSSISANNTYWNEPGCNYSYWNDSNRHIPYQDGQYWNYPHWNDPDWKQY
ncbi:hypothetical protein MHYP_G00247930 [Metynnis hypsauchen]